MMVGATVNFGAAFQFLRSFDHETDLIVLLSAGLALAWGFVMLSDAIIASDGPFSQYSFWSKFLAAGLVAVAGLSVSVAVLAEGSADGTKHMWRAINLQGVADSAYSVPALVLTSLATAWMSIRTLSKRVFFIQKKWFDLLLSSILFSVGFSSIRPVIQNAWPATRPENVQSFWRVLIGEHVVLAVSGAWFLAFNAAEFVNLRMRRRVLCDDEFRRTVWPSFPICQGACLIGILFGIGTSYAANLHAPWPLLVTAPIASAIACRWMTRVLLNRESAFSRSLIDAYGETSRGDE